MARVSLLVVAGLALLLLGSAASNPLMRLRLTSETDRDWYQARYDVAALPPLIAGTLVRVPVEVRNVGQRAWEPGGANAVRLSYRWLSADGSQRLAGDDARVDLPAVVPVGASVRVEVPLQMPAQGGDYVLAWDMLRENVLWFSAQGSPTHAMPVRVLPGAATADAPVQRQTPAATASPTVERLVLWRGALQLLAAHPLLGVGPGNFRLVIGAYLGQALWDNRLHANSLYFEMLADTGLVGAAVFALWLVLLVRRGARVLLASNRTAAATALTAALAVFLVHGATDYFLEFTPVYLLFWITIGLLLASHGEGDA